MHIFRPSFVSSLILVATVSRAQESSTASPISASSTASGTVATTTGSGSQACSTVSSLLASYATASPSSSKLLRLPAQLAYDCSQSAPIVKQDALQLIDGLTAFLQWQSTLAYLKDPPPGYLLAGVDLLGGMQDLRDQVQAGAFKSEIDFETNLTNLIGSAHDGHLAFVADGMGVFQYIREGLGQLVSISRNRKELPQIYSFNDLAYEKFTQIDWTPSPIVKIDGQNASDWLTVIAFNGTLGYQDPDALYNSLFYEVANSDATGGSFLAQLQGYLGSSVTATFANGTTQEYQNYAITQSDFTGVESGEAFYFAFCNATEKAKTFSGNAAATSQATNVRRQASATSAAPSTAPTPVTEPRTAYPSPVVVSPDGTIAGYFLTGDSYEKTAVLSILAESETDAMGCKQALSDFLALCRTQGKTHLVVDISNNPGGAIILGYEFFKQLFPSLDPYAAGQFRATTQYDILGRTITPLAEEALKEGPHNYTNFVDFGGYSIFDATSYDEQTGKPFTSWAEYFGPRELHGDNFTNLIRYNVSDPNFDEQYSNYGIVVSGYANDSNIPPQPFKSENMILLGDGACSSTCTTFGHLLKWQGKVKSVVVGGRPQTGPMQYIGGVKGKQVYPLSGISAIAEAFYQLAGPKLKAEADQTGLKIIEQLGEYVVFRCANPSQAGSYISVNIQNSIAEGDKTFTPLQFVYEAADCRLWWTADMVFDIRNVWKAAAAQAFGVNGTDVFAGCVAGSTGQKSSLSGNPGLLNGGTPTNVTQFVPEPDSSNGQSASASASASTSGTATGTGSASSPSATGNIAVRTVGRLSIVGVLGSVAVVLRLGL